MKPPKYPWNVEYDYTEEELELIDKINAVLTRPLSPRWIYYGIFDVPDAVQQKFMSELLGKARKDSRELIKRDMVTDDERKPTIWNKNKNLWEFLDKLTYMRDFWQDQPVYHEVWMEDQASLQSIKRSPQKILQKYRMNSRYCKGYNSIGAMWQAYNGDDNDNFEGFRNITKPIRILYYGDLNPSGWAIPIIIVRQFKEMGLDIELKRMALNLEQLKKYDIPAFTKISGDPRRKEFNLTFGFEDWENEPKQSYKDQNTGKVKWGKKHLNVDLEKIPPDLFEEILKRDIIDSIDLDVYEAARKMENEEDDKLEKLLDDLREMDEDYEKQSE